MVQSVGHNGSVARFLFTGTGEMYQITIKYTKSPQNIPNGHKMDLIDIIYTNTFHCKSLQNLPKMGYLV
jgi:hypothetical protein